MDNRNDIIILTKIEAVRKKYDLPSNIKLCILYILENGTKFRSYDEKKLIFIIANEMKRVGKKKKVAIKTLNRWVMYNDYQLKISDTEKAIKSAYEGNYKYGCNTNPIIVDSCDEFNGKDHCNLSQGKQSNNNPFILFKFGWPQVLTNKEMLVYLGIMYIEKCRNFNKGDLLFISHRHLASVVGGSHSYIKDPLEGLDKKGLIEYKSGKSFKWRKQASEIKRIVSIPTPKEAGIKLDQV
jgi:hypothetical protein